MSKADDRYYERCERENQRLRWKAKCKDMVDLVMKARFAQFQALCAGGMDFYVAKHQAMGEFVSMLKRANDGEDVRSDLQIFEAKIAEGT